MRGGDARLALTMVGKKRRGTRSQTIGPSPGEGQANKSGGILPFEIRDRGDLNFDKQQKWIQACSVRDGNNKRNRCYPDSGGSAIDPESEWQTSSEGRGHACSQGKRHLESRGI